MNEVVIGKFIKTLREKNNWTQEELADKIPIGRGAISKLERGKTIPDIDTLVKLSEIFKVSVDEILAGELKPKRSIALEIYKENKKLNHKFKISLIIIFILILSFFVYYFINQYKAINVYSLKGYTDDSDGGERFIVRNGFLIRTGDKAFFNLGKIVIFNNNIERTKRLTLIYKKDNKKIELYSTPFKNINFYDLDEFNQFFNDKNIEDVLDNLYLIINYEGGEEEVHLLFDKMYVNDNLFIFSS